MNDHLEAVAQVKSLVIDLAVKFGPKVFVAIVVLALVFRLGPHGAHKPRVLIGKDTRLSGYMLETAMASGISCSCRADAEFTSAFACCNCDSACLRASASAVSKLLALSTWSAVTNCFFKSGSRR